MTSLNQVDGGARPSEWHATQRLYPDWRADTRAYTEAFQAARVLPKASGRLDIPAWTLLGPSRSAGRIVDVAHNPRNPDTVYAAAATGGVFLSADGGISWEPIFDDQPTLSIGDIAIDPSNPTTIYVGTGEANGGHNNLPGAGLFKTLDGGRTWAPSGLDNSVSISRIVVDPADPNRVYAAVVGSYFAPGAQRGLYRSRDAGENWEQVFAPGEQVGAIDLVMHPGQTDTLYAATWDRLRNYQVISLSGEGSGIYRSYDGGDSWSRLAEETGFPVGPHIGRIGLTLCESEPEVLYASVNDGSNYLGIYRTSDGGDSWTDADPGQNARSATSNFSWYFGQVRVNPDDCEDVFFLDVRLARSRNGGSSWSTLSTGLHVDYHALEFAPKRPGHLTVGTDGGIGLSVDDAQSWQEVTDLPITQFYEVAIDASDPGRVFGGTQDLGTLRRDPTNGVWDMALGGDGFAPLINPIDPDVVYMQTQNGFLFKSIDGGNSGFAVSTSARGINSSEPTNWSTPVAMDPTNPDVLYYGTDRVYRTTDAAETWEAVSPRLPQKSLVSPRLGTVTAITVAPSDPLVVYAGTDDGRFWVALDTAGPWVDHSAGLPERWLTEIAVDPVEPLTVYATFSGLKWNDPVPHVFRSRDAGSSWTNVSGNLPDAPVNAIAIDPADPSMLFVGSDIGVFVSEDAGSTWAALADGMPVAAVYDLDIHPESRRLYASTHGRSIFETRLPVLSVGSERPTVQRPANWSIATWPNPFVGKLKVRIQRGPAEDRAPDDNVSIDVFDARGRFVRRITTDRQSGSAEFEWDGRNGAGVRASPGVYLLRVETPSGYGKTAAVVFLPDD